MAVLASWHPGSLGMDSVRGSDGFWITVSYWESEEAICNWEHESEQSNRATNEGRLITFYP